MGSNCLYLYGLYYMYNLSNKIRKVLDSTILFFCSFALLLLVVTVTWQVFSRYVLNDPSSFTDELSRFTMIWLGMLGACYLFGQKGHLAITLLMDKLSTRNKRVLQTIINLLTIIFALLAMLKGGYTLAERTMFQLSPALQLPMGYVYSILPISAVIIIIYLVLDIVTPENNHN